MKSSSSIKLGPGRTRTPPGLRFPENRRLEGQLKPGGGVGNGEAGCGPSEGFFVGGQILLKQRSCLCGGQAWASAGSVSSLRRPVRFDMSGQLSGEQPESASWKYGVAVNRGQPLLCVS